MPALRPDPAPRILFVDDEAVLLRAMSRLLERSGFVVRTASDGAAALELLRHEAFDAIVCDFHMPGAGGETVFHEVGRLCPALQARFVCASGDLLEPATESFLASTGCRAIAKPYDAADLVALLQSLLAPPAPKPLP